MRVWHESAAPDGAAALCFDAADIGEPNLGYIAENGALQRACIDSFREAGGRSLVRLGRCARTAARRRHGCSCSRRRRRRSLARGWWSAPTARTRWCARRRRLPVRVARLPAAGAGRDGAHRSGRTSTPPGSASCVPDRWRCCRCSMAAARSSGRWMSLQPAVLRDCASRGVQSAAWRRPRARVLGAMRSRASALSFPLRSVAAAQRTSRRAAR